MLDDVTSPPGVVGKSLRVRGDEIQILREDIHAGHVTRFCVGDGLRHPLGDVASFVLGASGRLGVRDSGAQEPVCSCQTLAASVPDRHLGENGEMGRLRI